MRFKHVLPLAFCSIFAFASCFSIGGLIASADAIVGEEDENLIAVNPFNGGVLSYTADSEFVSIDIPNLTYSNNNSVTNSYQYALDDFAYLSVDSDLGRFAVAPTDAYDNNDFTISFINKVFAPNWISSRVEDAIVYNTIYPCIAFNGLDALNLSLRAQFVIPNSQYDEDLPSDGIGGPDRYVNIERSFSARWIHGVDYMSQSLCLPLSDIFSWIYETYPYLRSRQNSFFATHFSLHFVDVPTQITFCNSGLNGDTALFPFFDSTPHAYSYIMEDFLAGEEDVVVVDGSPFEQLLAVPKSFLETEFIPGFTFGNLILIALGVVLFCLVLKVFVGG